MAATVSEECRKCLTNLALIRKAAIDTNKPLNQDTVRDLRERLSLWIGNIGALHLPSSSLSLETRLRESTDVLSYILNVLEELNGATEDLLDIATGIREGAVASTGDGDQEVQYEATELIEEMSGAITTLFRVSTLIRQVAPVDLFQKTLSRDRYRFNNQYDVAYVGEKYPKLAAESVGWLRQRLGEAITRRRHYLNYMYDHRAKLENTSACRDIADNHSPQPIGAKAPVSDTAKRVPSLDHVSRPDTFFTKVTAELPSGALSPQALVAQDATYLDDDDAKSYTTITRSIDGDYESSAAFKIPKLAELQKKYMSEIECPFCFRFRRFKSERQWQRHVFSDLRAYVCTFPDCNAAYFSDVDDWFQHEMQNHRVQFECQICSGKTFSVKDKYVAHVQNLHPDILKEADESLVLAISKQSLSQIPTEHCPCCSNWSERARASVVASETAEGLQDLICAEPRVFKRHLATHLEQLALFAVPFVAGVDDDAESNAALVTHDPSDQLDALFVNEDSERQVFTEAQIEEIGRLLDQVKPQWSAVPRLYIILRVLDRLEMLDPFIASGLSDYHIPFKFRYLQRTGFEGDFSNFQNAQRLVLTADPTGCSVVMRQHCWYESSITKTLFSIEHLVALTYTGHVDVVAVVCTGHSYTRNIYKRLTGRAARWQMAPAITEIETLQRLRHPNIVTYAGSFTDPDYIGCILIPAADETLDNHLTYANGLRF